MISSIEPHPLFIMLAVVAMYFVQGYIVAIATMVISKKYNLDPVDEEDFMFHILFWPLMLMIHLNSFIFKIFNKRP